jgi:hypothetical protein
MFTLQVRKEGENRKFKYFNLGDDFEINGRVVTGRVLLLNVTVNNDSVATIFNGDGNVVHVIMESE